MSTIHEGHAAEEHALKYLIDKGYKLAEQNYNVRDGEIDLVMYDGEFTVFIEVKSINKFTNYSIYQAVTKQKKKRLLKAIKSWNFIHQNWDNPWRVDFIGIVYKGNEYSIEHFSFVSID